MTAECGQYGKKEKNLLQRGMGCLGEIFAPLVPALIFGGLILGLRNIIGEIRFLEGGTRSMAELFPFWAGAYSFLWLIGEAVFYLLPTGIVWSVTKRMGTTEILGIVLGLTLVSPRLVNGFSAAEIPADCLPVWDFGFARVGMTGYQGQVITAILAGLVLAGLEKLFRRICPQVVSMIVVPFCSLLLAAVIVHTVIGPIGVKIAALLAGAVYGGLTSGFGVLLAGAFGFLYVPLVMTGLHHMTIVIDCQLISLYGGTILWPMIALSNIAQGSAALAVAVLQRRDERAARTDLSACLSCFLGVTEPALFGVNRKYDFPMVCGMIGSSIPGMLSVGSGVQAVSIGVGGLPGILSVYFQYWGMFLLSMGAAIMIPFVLTLLAGSRKLRGSL